MIKKIKIALATLALAIAGTTPIAVPAMTYAATSGITSSVCTGSQAASGAGTNAAGSGSCTDSQIGDAQGTGIKQVAGKIINIISIIVGVISIIFIIYGGFRYITSGGDSGKVGNAKNTLIYAVIGLVVVALAQVIVNVVLTTATNVANP